MDNLPSSAEAEAEPIYVFRVPSVQGNVRPLARFVGYYDVVEGCLAFIVGEETYLPALSFAGESFRTGQTVTLGSTTIELGQRVTPSGAVLDDASARRADVPPPPACADWPKIRF